MLFILLLCMFFSFQKSCAMENQARKRASTAEFTFYVATQKNLERNRAASTVEPRHKKTFTEAYNLLTPPQSPTTEEKSPFPAYLQNVPQIRTPRGSIMTQRKVIIKKQKSACVACVIQ